MPQKQCDRNFNEDSILFCELSWSIVQALASFARATFKISNHEQSAMCIRKTHYKKVASFYLRINCF